MKRLGTTILLAALAACGGNYSNEDVEFQAALPAEEELAIRAPIIAVDANAPEYYRLTRTVIATSNAMVAGVVRLIDGVRAYPASERRAGRRVWGPFADDKHPGWSWVVTIVKAPDPAVPGFGYRFEYSFELVPTATPTAARTLLLAGKFLPGMSAERGAGSFLLDTRAARAVGFPADDPADPDDLNELATFEAHYSTGAFPIELAYAVSNVPTARDRGATYAFRGEADGSGRMTFTLESTSDVNVREVTIVSRWRADRAGRADATITKGLPALVGIRGTDCWAADSSATYVSRPWQPEQNRGSEAACVLPAP